MLVYSRTSLVEVVGGTGAVIVSPAAIDIAWQQSLSVPVFTAAEASYYARPWNPLIPTGSTDTWNPLDKSASMVLSDGNRTATNVNAFAGVRTVGSHSTGKWYFELVVGTFTGNLFDDDGIGIVIGATALTSIAYGVNTLFVRNDGLKYVGGVSTGVSVNALFSSTIGFAIDLDTKRAWIRNTRNGNGWTGPNLSPADPETALNGIDVSGIFGVGVPVFPCVSGDNSTTDIVTFNQINSYTAPIGFLPW